MPLKKYASMPTGRMAAYFLLSGCRDTAIIDFSTAGHALFNRGHLPRLSPYPAVENLFTARLTETEAVLGDFSSLTAAAKEAAAAGYSHAVLIPSAIGGVLGYDFESLAELVTGETGLKAFTLPIKLYDDFYKGSEITLSALARKFAHGKTERLKNTFAVLGGGFTQNDKKVNAEIAELASSRFGHECVFVSSRAENITDWRKSGEASYLLAASYSALPAAEYFNKTFGTPFVYARTLGKKSEDELLRKIATLTGEPFEPQADECYDFAAVQFANILKETRAEIVCYADTDRLRAVKNFFAEFGIEAKCYCSHGGADEPYTEINGFIDNFADSDAVVLSYDSVCRRMRKGVTLDHTGQFYKLLTPLCSPQSGKDGAYMLMRSIADTLL